MNKKIVLVILLVVFLTGIAIAPVNAKKHTYNMVNTNLPSLKNNIRS